MVETPYNDTLGSTLPLPKCPLEYLTGLLVVLYTIYDYGPRFLWVIHTPVQLVAPSKILCDNKLM